MSPARSPLAGVLPELFAKRDAGDKRLEVERDTPGTVRFDGLLAGLFGRTGSGDRNDPANYSIFCPACGSALGVLARYRADRSGHRVVRCLGQGPDGKTCDVVTVMKDAQPVRVAPGAAWDSFVAQQTAKRAHERALESIERAERERKDFDDV